MARRRKYHLGLPKWPQFAIMLDDVDGPIPSTRIGSWRDFHEIVDSDFFDFSGECIYRGQQVYSWGLEPSLARETDNDSGTVDPKKAALQLERFTFASRGRKAPFINVPAEDQDNELWAIGQHHGLGTPLLDWTFSPYVALFFAFEKDDDPHERSYSRTVFALNKTWLDQFKDDTGSVQVFQPHDDGNQRLLSQSGLFTIAPYGETIESWIVSNFDEADDPAKLARIMCKIHVPNEGREECLRHLNLMNINHASLFPDLIGAAEYCNMKMDIPGY